MSLLLVTIMAKILHHLNAVPVFAYYTYVCVCLLIEVQKVFLYFDLTNTPYMHSSDDSEKLHAF